MNTQDKIDALNAQFSTIHAMAIDTGISMNESLDLIEAQIWTLKAQLQNEIDVEQVRRNERKAQREAIDGNESIEPVSVETTDDDVLHIAGYYKAVAAITGTMNHCDAVRGSNAFHGVVKQAIQFKLVHGKKPAFTDLIYSGLNSIKARVFDQLDNMNLVTLL